MLHRIQISTNTCEVAMQVKRAIGRATIHKLPIYNEYMRLCWVSALFCMICCLFSNCSKNSNIRLRSLPCVVNVPHSHVPVLLALQWSVAWISAFYRGRKHLWIVFSFNSHYLSKCSTCTYMHGYHQYRTLYTFHLQKKPPISTPPQPVEGAYFFCLCVSSHSRIFHSYGDVTIDG